MFAPSPNTCDLLAVSRAADDDGLCRAIGHVIRQQRRNQGLTLEQVSGRVGCNLSHLSAIERGVGSPTVMMTARICEALGLGLSELFLACELRMEESQ